jgi:AAA15 family ATPase/GTPase
MVLEFAVENFRSIKARQVLSLVAESTKAKSNNVFEVVLPNGSVRLLKTAVIYGPNASGKSNLIRAFAALVSLVRSRNPGVGKRIHVYDPFRFSADSENKPTCFELTFVFEDIKYVYEIAFNERRIVQEELVYFPKGQKRAIFSRIDQPSELLHQIKLGKSFGNGVFDVFQNQTGINKFGTDRPHKLLTKIYNYFSQFDIVGSQTSIPSYSPMKRHKLLLEIKGNPVLYKQLEKLIHAADAKIDGVGTYSKEIPVSALQEGDERTFGYSSDEEEIEVALRHKVFRDGKHLGYEELPLDEESEGTKLLFWYGGLILQKLSTGGIIIVDELDNSLHPKLVKYLVMLFTHPKTNPKNAQLIFATHEVTLLDRDLFRTDQIWFTEKNDWGETELFSVQDFEGVREDVPFEKWYMAGKFGGLPNLADIESIFGE